VRLHGKVVVEEGATLRNCVVRGPAIIGSGTVVDNAYIGPFTSIYFDCVVRNAEIENSIVLEGTRIHDVAGKIDGSPAISKASVAKTPEA